MKRKALICAGFHRSATSATANLLLNAGLHMGDQLMPGGISNQKGHFEDIEVVNLHDAQLQQAGTNWQFHGEVDLPDQPGFLESYVSKRFADHKLWGVKDPRACLFLEEWDSTLGSDGCYLFVIRHWTSCIESLHNRHSRELAFELENINSDSQHIQFWSNPQLAAKMWLVYNERMLSFAKANPDKVAIVSQRALFSGMKLIDTLNEKFELSLDSAAPSPLETKLISDSVNRCIVRQLSTSLKFKLDTVWNELLGIANLFAADERPNFFESSSLSAEKIESQSNLYHYKPLVESKKPVSHSVETWEASLLSKHCKNEIKSLVDKAPIAELREIHPDSWLPHVRNLFPLDGDLHLSCGKLLMRTKHYQHALECFKHSISLGTYFPYIDMHIAQCYQELNDRDHEAEFFYKKAIQASTTNPGFYAHFARFLLSRDRLVEAEDYLKISSELGGNSDLNTITRSQILARKDKLEDAIVNLQSLVQKSHTGAIALDKRLRATRRRSANYELYRDLVIQELHDQNLEKWLATTCMMIDSFSSELDFTNRCYEHWRNLGLINSAKTEDENIRS